MKGFSTAACVTLVVLLSGCSTYAVSRYSPDVDNVVALRSIEDRKISIGEFSSSESDTKEIMCRGVGPIKTPDGETYSEFVREAFIDELKMAGIYSESASVTLRGNLDQVDFSSTSGVWNLALTVKSSTGGAMSVSEDYEYKTSFYGETACNQTAQALMPAVQNLVGKVVRSQEFDSLVR